MPSDRRRALVAGHELPDRAWGAALFADVSGFTPLTEKLLQALGPQRGAEELTDVLNQVYETLIAEVDRFGGSVIGFSGDALTAWFETDDGLRAATCALAMQQSMGEFNRLRTPAGEPIALAIKIALAVGEARRYLVGDPQIQLLDVLAGGLTDELAAAEGLARPGQIVLGPSALQALGARAELARSLAGPWQPAGAAYGLLQTLREPAQAQQNRALLISDQLTQRQLRAWILPAVFERLQQGQVTYLAELRSVAALFVRFGGIDYEQADSGERLDRYIRWVQHTLARFEGNLLELTIGDKGSYFYAVFGAPLAHEDDPARAAAAALALRQSPKDQTHITPPQIGLSYGRMRVGAYGGSSRSTYGVQGNEANIAARLMSQAELGQILVSERVARQLEAESELAPLGALTIKGQSEPLPVFALLAARSERLSALDARQGRPLLGRAEERRALAGLLAQAIAGEAPVFILEGEAGIGKSRLLAEVLARASEVGIACLIGAGDSIEQNTAYHAWRPIFRSLLGLQGLDAPEALRQALRRRLAGQPDLLERAPLLNVLLPFNLPESPLTLQMQGELRASNTRELMRHLLAQAAEVEPQLVILDDAHWLDSASWALLEQVQLKVERMPLLIATRPFPESSQTGASALDRAPPEFQRLLQVADSRRLHLGALPADEIPDLIRQRLGVESLPKEVIELVLEHGEGHPFFSEELAYALRDSGLIEIRGSQARLTVAAGDLAALDFPATIQGVITSRLDHLASDELLTLKVASVIGRIFAFRALQEVHPAQVARLELEDQMNRLVQLDITPVETPQPDLRYIFKQALTHDITYQLMLFSQRRELHRAVASWIEAQAQETTTTLDPLLAHHWSLAAGEGLDDPVATRKAMDSLSRAGEAALAQSAYQEAISFFSRALGFLERQSGAAEPLLEPRLARRQRARWTWKMGEAYRSWGDFKRGQERLERAAALYGRPIPASKAGLFASLLYEVLRQALRRLIPFRRPAGLRPVDRERLLETARVYQLLGELYFFANRRVESLYTIVRMLNMSEPAGPSPELAEAYAAGSLMSGIFGLHALAERYHQRAMQAAEPLAQAAVEADVLRVDGLYRVGIGAWVTAERHLERALEIAQSLGDARHGGDCLTLLSDIAFHQGHYSRSLELAEQVLQAGRRDDSPILKIWGLLQRGAIKLRQGQFQAAIAAAQEALELISEHTEGAAEIYALGSLALAQWGRGDAEAAQSAAQRAATLIAASNGQPSAFNVLEGYLATAEVFLHLWQESADRQTDSSLARQARAASKALHTYRRLFPIGAPAAWLVQGRYELLSGSPARALKSWERGYQAAEQLQMPFERARICYEYGRHPSSSLDERRRRLEQAQEIFQQLRAHAELARTRTALEEAS